MPEKVIRAKASRHAVDLGISLLGMRLTVSSGPFTIEGVQYSLDEDENFTATADPSSVTTLEGFLVSDSGEGRVLVNEILPGEPSFDFSNSPYVMLHRLFTLRVQPGAVGLSEDDLTTFMIKEPV